MGEKSKTITAAMVAIIFYDIDKKLLWLWIDSVADTISCNLLELSGNPAPAGLREKFIFFWRCPSTLTGLLLTDGLDTEFRSCNSKGCSKNHQN
jgi:hypothetical protein